MFAFIVRCAGMAVLLMATAAGARELLRPAELPPADYSGQQYVDSKGCLFLRAGIGGTVNWVARVTREGIAVCGYPPSGNRVPIVGDGAATETEDGSQPLVKAAPDGRLLVAIGSFAVAANADRAARALTALGLTVMRGTIVQNGITLVSLSVGPFDTRTAADDALNAVRGAGYADAQIMGR
jgi:SPOR domain